MECGACKQLRPQASLVLSPESHLLPDDGFRLLTLQASARTVDKTGTRSLTGKV